MDSESASTDAYQGWKRKTKNRTVSLHRGDFELLAWGSEFLGCSQSELIRVALRAYVFHLDVISKQLRDERPLGQDRT